MNYAHYDVRDFVMDEFFQQWVLHPDPDVEAFWDNWLKSYPEKAATVQEARHVMQAIGFRKDIPSADDFSEVWAHISQKKHENKDFSYTLPVAGSSTVSTLRWYQMAAVLAMLALASIMALFLLKDNRTEYTTHYGETRTVLLPDGSLVTLNANSTLQFAAAWDTLQPREVWLEGEAFFEVKKLHYPAKATEKGSAEKKVKFIVHTSQLDVEVLGTEFNVKNRRGSTKIVLNSGKVLLRKEDQALAMVPGELVAVTEDQQGFLKQTVDTDIHSAWKNHQFIFDNTSLQEVATMLEDTYGYKIIIKESGMSDKRISSTTSVSTRNTDEFLQVIQKLYGIETKREQKTISFQ